MTSTINHPQPIAAEKASFWSGDGGWRPKVVESDNKRQFLLPEDLAHYWKHCMSFVNSEGIRCVIVPQAIDSLTFQEYYNAWFWYTGWTTELFHRLERRYQNGYFKGIEPPYPEGSHECFLFSLPNLNRLRG